MCEPATLTMISIGMSAVGTVMGAVSASNAASAKRDADEYNAAIQRNNAIAADYQAEDAYKRGEIAVENNLRKAAALKGKQTATMAANGLDLSEGTPLNILTDTDLFAAEDSNTIRYNAGREAWAYKNQSSNYTSQANLAQMSADNQDPMMAGVSSLVTGASSVADKWYRYKSGNTGIYIG